MGLAHGSGLATKAYLGTTEVSKVCLGSALAYARAFTPLDLPAGQALRIFDGLDQSSISRDGSSLIAQVNDKSGNGGHLVQTTTARKPTYDAAEGAIVFPDGTDDLGNNSPCMMNSAGNRFVYAVVKAPGQSGAGTLVSEGSNGGATNMAYTPLAAWNASSPNNRRNACVIQTDASSFLAANNTGNTTDFYDDTKRVLRWRDYRNGASSYYDAFNDGARDPGVQTYNRSSGTFTPTRFTVGGLGAYSATGVSQRFTGRIYDLIVTNSDAYGEIIEGALAWKHGIQAKLPLWHPFRNRKPTILDVPASIPTITTPLKVALIGDSQSEYNSTAIGNDLNKNIGFFGAYNALAGNRFDFQPSRNKGVAGRTSAQIFSAIATDLAGLDFDVCHLMGGINDVINNMPSGTTISNLGKCIDYVCGTLGKRLILSTVMPLENWAPMDASAQATAKARIATIAAWILNQHGSYQGKVVVADARAAFSDGSGNAKTNATYDGIHFSPYGAMLIGQAMASQLEPYYPKQATSFTTGNLLTNGLLAGSGGTAGSNVSGQVATGFTATGTGGTNGRTASKVTADAQRLAMAVTGGTSADTMRLSQSISSGFVAGDRVYGLVEVEVTNPTVGIQRSALDLVLTGSFAGDTGVSAFQNTSTYPVAEQYMAPGKYLIVTPDFVIPSGTGLALEWRYEMKGDSSSTPTSGQATITGAGIFKR